MTDSPILSFDWGEGEPNDDLGVGLGVDEDCLVLFGAPEPHRGDTRNLRDVWYRFNDDKCDHYFIFICEKSE